MKKPLEPLASFSLRMRIAMESRGFLASFFKDEKECQGRIVSSFMDMKESRGALMSFSPRMQKNLVIHSVFFFKDAK